MIALVVKIFLMTMLPDVGNGYNSVGKVCTTDSDCTGPNEMCQQLAWFDSTTAMCVCKANYTIGDLTADSPYSTNNCAKLMTPRLGEMCDTSNDYQQVIPLTNARCNANTAIVECNDDSIQYQSFCLKNYGFPFVKEGAECVESKQCGGEMGCYNSVCRCNFYMKYDTTTGRCVRREFGDACTSKYDCISYAKHWQGYTSHLGACIDGKCDCAVKAKTTTVSYFDEFTGVLTDKTICVTEKANTDLGEGGECYLDPAYWSQSTTFGVCAQGYVCAVVPSDVPSTISGYCRQPIADMKTVMLSFQFAGPLPTTVSGLTAPADALKTPDPKATTTPAVTVTLGHTTAQPENAAQQVPESAGGNNSEPTLSIGAIAGIVIGAIGFLIILAIALCCYKKSSSKKTAMMASDVDQKKIDPTAAAGERPTLEMRSSSTANRHNIMSTYKSDLPLPNTMAANRNQIYGGQFPASYALTGYGPGDTRFY